MKTLFCILLVISSLTLNGQNKTVSAQVSKEYCLENHFSLNSGELKDSSIVRTIKTDYLNTDLNQYRFLIESIHEKIKSGELQVLNKEDNSRLTSSEAEHTWLDKDTIQAYNINYEPIQQLVVNDRFDEINFLKINQNWIIENGIFKIENTAIIPLLPVLDGSGSEILYQDELFVIPMSNSEIEKKSIINNPDNTWIKLSVNYFDFDRLNLGLPFMEKLEELVWNQPKQGKTPIYSGRELQFNDALPLDFIQKEIIESNADTIITYDLETYFETKRIVKRGGYNFKDVDGLKVYQLWIWNDKKSELSSIPIGIGPFIKEEKYHTLYAIKLREVN